MPVRVTMSIALVLSLLLAAAGAVGCGGEASAGDPPPHWLLEKMTVLASGCGDSQASASWTLTTAEKAAAVAGEDAPSQAADPDRPVYVFILHGDFTRWGMLFHAPGAPWPHYRWLFSLADAKSQATDGVGARDKPLDTSGLTMHPVTLLKGFTQ